MSSSVPGEAMAGNRRGLGFGFGGFFAPELVRAWLTGEDSRAGQERGKSNWDLDLGGKRNIFFGFKAVEVFGSLGLGFVLSVLGGFFFFIF